MKGYKNYPTVKVPLHGIEESYRGIQYNAMAEMTGVGKAEHVSTRRATRVQPREFNAAEAAGFSQQRKPKTIRNTINSSKSNNWIRSMLR